MNLSLHRGRSSLCRSHFSRCPNEESTGDDHFISYVERNYEMIEKSDYAIFYFDEAYTVKSGRYPSKSGTRLAYEFAMKKDVEIYNVANKQAF